MLKRCLGILAITFLALAQSGLKSGIDRSTLDTSCKPCDDFWRYANGTWLDKNPIPAEYARWGSFTILRDANLERTKVILENAGNAKSGTDERRVGDFYASCLDERAVEAAGITPLNQMLTKIGSIKTREDVIETLKSWELAGTMGVARVFSGPDRENSQAQITNVGNPAGLSLPDQDYYVKEDARSKEIRDEFLKHVARMLELMGDAKDTTAQSAKDILDFETLLVKAQMSRAERRDPNRTFNKMTFAGLKALAPAYDWDGVFKTLSVPTNVAINVSEPAYIKAFQTQLTSAPIATWKTWMRWRVVNERAEFLSKPFADERFHFRSTILSGVKEQQPRWKMCAAQVDRLFPDALGQLWVAKHFPPEAKRRMAELVDNMREALRQTLEEATWLEPATRQNAIKKLEAFNPKIGYPVKWRSYEKIDVKQAEFDLTLQSAELEGRRIDLAKIGKRTDREEMNMTPPTVNASYNALTNSITFPAGVLQPPFFYLEADDAVNYGAIGAAIGHEMGHGFDDQGSKFDADGNLKMWWTDSDRKKFEARANCVTSQFDSIDAGNGIRHNGKLVTGEAMGDLGGLTLAYRAYHNALKGKEAPVLDGFTGDQRFFLAFARVWAEQARLEQLRLQVTTDPHPIARFRANATLQNMTEFHKAFACKLGDAMVRPPDQQCRLW
jgi:predicted metalloendopeptidase